MGDRIFTTLHVVPFYKINLHVFRLEKRIFQPERDGKNRNFSADRTAQVFLHTRPRWLLVLFTKESEYASTSKSITLHGWRGGHGEAEWHSSRISKCARKSGLCLFRSCPTNKTPVFFRTFIKISTPVYSSIQRNIHQANQFDIYWEVCHLQHTYITYILPYRSDGQIMKAYDKTRITIAAMKVKDRHPNALRWTIQGAIVSVSGPKSRRTAIILVHCCRSFCRLAGDGSDPISKLRILGYCS